MENKPIRTVKLSDERLKKLRRFNLIMGAFHLIQGILMIILSNDSKYTIYSNYLTLDTAQFKLLPTPETFIELPFGIAVAVFLLISAVAHFLLGTVLFNWYGKALRSHKNPARFFEYAFKLFLDDRPNQHADRRSRLWRTGCFIWSECIHEPVWDRNGAAQPIYQKG